MKKCSKKSTEFAVYGNCSDGRGHVRLFEKTYASRDSAIQAGQRVKKAHNLFAIAIRYPKPAKRQK